MVIRNTSFLLIASLVVVNLLGCQIFQKKSQKKSDDVQVITPPKVHVPKFVGKRTPNVGVILGPGGAKSFAHIGVLQEMERHKIPVKAVAGLGWGALVGGLYALNGQVHEVDWKMAQIPKLNFSSKTFFSRQKEPLAVKEFDSYFNNVFKGKSIQRTKVPFACPYIAGTSGRVTLAKRGSARAHIKACWQYPPIFEINSVMGAPFALSEAVNFLISEGAELIVLVDVLGRADQKDFGKWEDGQWSWLVWTPVQEALKNSQYYGIHEKVVVDTTSYSMTDVEQRLRLIQLGKQESAAIFDKMVEKYDF